MLFLTSAGDGIMPPTLEQRVTGLVHLTASSISSIIWPIESSTEMKALAVFALSNMAFFGKGQRVIGLNMPAFMPSALAALTAFFATLAAMPKPTTTISASSQRYSSYRTSSRSTFAYLA